jgi:CysZ protein
MIAAFSKAVGQLSDPASRGVLWRAVAGSLLIFLLLWAGAGLLYGWAGDGLGAWLASWDLGQWWVDAVEWLAGGVAVVALLVVTFLLFPAAVTFVLSFLLEDIARAVERRHYPELPPAREQPLGEAIVAALSFFATTVMLNLLLLPVYLLLLFLPPFNVFVFYGVNGYLLGREYFELVAARRLDSREAKRLRRRFRGTVFVAGVIIAFLLTLPVVNLVTPLVATGFLLHLFESMRRRA